MLMNFKSMKEKKEKQNKSIDLKYTTYDITKSLTTSNSKKNLNLPPILNSVDSNQDQDYLKRKFSQGRSYKSPPIMTRSKENSPSPEASLSISSPKASIPSSVKPTLKKSPNFDIKTFDASLKRPKQPLHTINLDSVTEALVNEEINSPSLKKRDNSLSSLTKSKKKLKVQVIDHL